MTYKNVSSSVKTFHGVTFKPGEAKQVSQYINNKFMILTDGEPIEFQKNQKKPSSEKSKDEAQKKDDPKQNQKKDEAKQDETSQKKDEQKS